VEVPGQWRRRPQSAVPAGAGKAAGDAVLGRYRAVAIDARTIQVMDMQNNNAQKLQLLAN
jgi:hypothetical protein